MVRINILGCVWSYLLGMAQTMTPQKPGGAALRRWAPAPEQASSTQCLGEGLVDGRWAILSCALRSYWFGSCRSRGLGHSEPRSDIPHQLDTGQTCSFRFFKQNPPLNMYLQVLILPQAYT